MADTLPPLPAPNEPPVFGYTSADMRIYAAQAAAEAVAAERERCMLRAAQQWVPVTERMPKSGQPVMVCYRNRFGHWRRIRAEWVAAKTQESDTDSEIGEYDEATDTYYDPEGWYERIDNWDDYSAVVVHDGEPTHWMPLPEPPKDAARGGEKQ